MQCDMWLIIRDVHDAAGLIDSCSGEVLRDSVVCAGITLREEKQFLRVSNSGSAGLY